MRWEKGKQRGPSRSSVFLLVLGTGIALLGLAFAHARHAQQALAPAREERAALVRRLGLTDLCLFTEAQYTRHPSVALLPSPFLDHPLALEHFPSGSLVPAPVRKERPDANRP